MVFLLVIVVSHWKVINRSPAIALTLLLECINVRSAVLEPHNVPSVIVIIGETGNARVAHELLLRGRLKENLMIVNSLIKVYVITPKAFKAYS